MPPIPWFNRTTIYQIYPRSFLDSNADGIGDIPGIIHKLDYIWDLGFETIWCSPFFRSPQSDFGYDISDYREIAAEYGTLEDARELIRQVHRRGMRIILDLVLNHTSDQHPWFLESRSSRMNPKADWYIWRDRPNNWQSYTRRSGWHYAPERSQYYWASFLPFQPDLNYRNPAVKQAMFDIMRFWLEQGVDGFRLDMFNSIYKHAGFPDNPRSWQFVPTDTLPARFFQQARYNINQPESFTFAQELRALCDEYGEKMLLGEVSGPRPMIREFMGTEAAPGLTHVFDFSMMNFRFTSDYFRAIIRDIESHFTDPFLPVYVFSNHDSPRSISRNGGDQAKAKLLHLLQLTVRGVPCMYYGEELGMTNGRIPRRAARDPVAREFRYIPGFVVGCLGFTLNRDIARTPMQWDLSRNAGFSAASSTWLPVNSDYPLTNVAAESDQPDSLLNTIQNLLRIRSEEPALHSGSIQLIDGLPAGILAYTRHYGGDAIAVFMNFTGGPVRLGRRGDQWIAIYRLSPADDFEAGEIILGPFSGMVLKRPRTDLKRSLEKARMRTS